MTKKSTETDDNKGITLTRETKMYVGDKLQLENARTLANRFGANDAVAFLRFAYLYVLRARPSMGKEEIRLGNYYYLYNNTVNTKELNNTLNGAKGNEINCLAVFLSDPRNLKAVIEAMPDEDRRLFITCAREQTISKERVRKLFNMTVEQAAGSPRMGIYHVVRKPTTWRTHEETKRFPYLTITRAVRELLLTPLMGKTLYDTGVDALPEGLTTFNDQELFVSSITRYDSLIKANVISVSTDKPKASEIKGLRDSMPLSEFFTGPGVDTTAATARSRMVAYMLNVFKVKHAYRKLSGPDRCKMLLDNPGDYESTFARNAMLPQLHGRFAGNNFDSISSFYARKIFALIMSVSRPFGWMDVERFMKFTDMLIDRTDDSSYPLKFNLFDFNRMEPYIKISDGHKKEIDYGDYDRLVRQQLIRSAFFMLAAIGVIEIAYKQDNGWQESPFQGVEYWRLTDLGRYCAGITRECRIKPQERDLSKYYAVDNRLLLITVLDDNAPMKGALSQLARRVTTNRWQVTPQSFLEGCYTPGDVEERIKVFKEMFCSDPPDNWTGFFELMKARACAVTERPEKFKVYTIDPNDAELRGLLTSDPLLSRIVICARGFNILVAHENADAFDKAMRSHGYII